MDVISYILLAFAVLVSAFFIYVSNGQTGIKSLVFKAISSFLFTILALYACFLNGFIWGSLLFIVGFIASCFGDVILGLPGFPELKAKKQNLILFGGLAFAVAHTAYYIGMIILFGWAWWTVLVAVAFATFFYFFNKIVMKINYGKLSAGILVYAFFISVVLCQGLYALIALQFSLYAILIAIGFLCFYISDVVLMKIYFGENQNNVKLYYYNLSFYYVAQILLATSIYFII
jgi:hypothetical protein